MKYLLVGLLSLMVLVAACGDDDDDDDDDDGNGEPISGTFEVDSIEVLQLESFPIQVSVEASGTLPGSCTEVSDVDIDQEGNLFTVSIETLTATDVACTLDIIEHTESVSLGSPDPGDYTVTVNSVSEDFTVPGDGDGASEPCTPPFDDPDEPVSSDDPPPCPEEPIDESQYEIADFGVSDVEVAIAESFPVQVFVAAHGTFSDGCTEIHEVDVRQQGNEFIVEITTRRPIGAICTQAIVEHTENVPLGSPDPGDYTVTVNGVSADFTVPG